MAGSWIQIALEETPNGEHGTADVSSNVFYLRADSIDVKDGFEALEESGKTVGVIGKGPHLGAASYAPTVEIKGLNVRPSDLGLVLGLWGGVITTTAGAASGVTDPESAAVPVGANKHVITLAADTPKTAQIIVKDAAGLYWKVRGAAISKIACSFKSGGAFSPDISLTALHAVRISDPSLTPSFDTATAFRGGDFVLTWLSGSADTKEFTVDLENGLETSQSHTAVSDFPDLIMFKNDVDGCPSIGGDITKRTLDTTDLDALTAGTQFAGTIKLTHRENIGATGRTSAVWIAMPGCQHVSADLDEIKNVRRREGKFAWEARVDYTTASLATITVVNGTAAYETYA